MGAALHDATASLTESGSASQGVGDHLALSRGARRSALASLSLFRGAGARPLRSRPAELSTLVVSRSTSPRALFTQAMRQPACRSGDPALAPAYRRTRARGPFAIENVEKDEFHQCRDGRPAGWPRSCGNRLKRHQNVALLYRRAQGRVCCPSRSALGNRARRRR